jgi:hypothetical protein
MTCCAEPATSVAGAAIEHASFDFVQLGQTAWLWREAQVLLLAALSELAARKDANSRRAHRHAGTHRSGADA